MNVGLVQMMTTGEAEKLLSAKGYLKSQRQAMIGTKVAGRVEEMRVQEHDEVKKGDILAVIEHHDLVAMIEQRKAGLEKSQGRPRGSQGRPLGEETRGGSGRAARGQEDGDPGRLRESLVRPEDVHRQGRVARGQIKMMKANINEMEYTLKYQMHILAPFDGTVVEKQGEIGEIIAPMAMSSSLGRSAVVTIADLKNMDVETDISENLMSRIALGQPAEVSVSAVPEQALPRPAPPDHPHGRSDPGHGEGEGRDPRSRRQALSRAGGDRPLPALQDRRRRPRPTSPICSCPSPPCSRKTGMTYVWVVGQEVAGQQEAGRGGHDQGGPGPRRVWPRVRTSRSSSTLRNRSRKTKRSGSPNDP